MTDLYRKGLILAVIVLFVGAGVAPNIYSNDWKLNTVKAIDIDNFYINDEREYWALLIAVGVYADNPDEDIPSMLTEVDYLYDMLLDSDRWSADHIKVIKGEDATVLTIILGLRWLDKMDDSDDISLVYIATHGSPLKYKNGDPIDIPPRDEADGADEILVTYWGFEYNWAFIWDDELNLLLNCLDSKGVCLIVDSCYAGGFNDPLYWNWFKFGRNTFPFYKNKNIGKNFSPLTWMKGFGEDVSGKGRVVLMACQEDEVSYVGSGFTIFLIDGFRGYGDVNMDGVVSAEEAFNYTKSKMGGYWQHPTMFDAYPGELPLTEVTIDL